MRLGYLYSRYPVLSQTFCDTEMLELERRGHELVIASMYPPKTSMRHEYLAQIRAPIHYAPAKPEMEQLRRRAERAGRWPLRLIAQHEAKYAEYKAALRARNAVFFADLFERERVPHFHVHFTNRAAHTALFVKAISGIPFSVTAHGQDFMIDLGNEELLREICASADFVAAETDYSRDVLAARCPNSAEKIFRVYNGMDLERFPETAPRPRPPGSYRLLSVGRLVAFKGFDLLIEVCTELRRAGVDFVCEIVGDGPLRELLQGQIEEHNLAAHVFLSGERSQNYVLNALANCDAFVLAAVVDERGASDVFPTVIAEAMASGKPVVSTIVAGIPELVVNEETGLLVPTRDVRAVADAITELSRDPAACKRMGTAGRRRVESHFAIERTIEPLLRLFAKQHAV